MRSRPPDSKASRTPQRPPLPAPPKGLWPPTLPTMTLRTQRAPEPPLAFTGADAEEPRAQDVGEGQPTALRAPQGGGSLSRKQQVGGLFLWDTLLPWKPANQRPVVSCPPAS